MEGDARAGEDGVRPQQSWAWALWRACHAGAGRLRRRPDRGSQALSSQEPQQSCDHRLLGLAVLRLRPRGLWPHSSRTHKLSVKGRPRQERRPPRPAPSMEEGTTSPPRPAPNGKAGHRGSPVLSESKRAPRRKCSWRRALMTQVLLNKGQWGDEFLLEETKESRPPKGWR